MPLKNARNILSTNQHIVITIIIIRLEKEFTSSQVACKAFQQGHGLQLQLKVEQIKMQLEYRKSNNDNNNNKQKKNNILY